VNPDTGLVPVWLAHRPDRGDVHCHPVPLNIQLQDKELFLSAFDRPFEMTFAKNVLKAFPPYDGGDFLTWHARVVSHLQAWLFYSPPAHTYREDLPLGIWFSDLRLHTKVDVQNVFGSLLAQALRYKGTGLLFHPAMAQIVQQSENGYEMLYQLAVLHGHPLLQAFPTSPVEPRQDDDCTLSALLVLWISHLQHLTLHGIHLSDRYWIQQFCGSLHPSLRSLLYPMLIKEVNHFYIHDPLPLSFGPSKLYSKLHQFFRHMNQSRLATASPREVSRSTQVVRELSVPSPEDDDLLLAALSSSPAPHCFMCGSKDHVVLACPQYSNIQSNSFARRLLIRLLSDQLKSPGPPKVDRRAPKKAVRAVHQDLHPPSSDSDDDSVSLGPAALPSSPSEGLSSSSDFR
jgi:hypothetical protein